MPAQQRIALTGTPIENRLSELWSILDAVNPGLLGPAHAFRTAFAGPIERNKDPVATAKLRTIAEPVLLRRTKADKRLLPDLPDKIEQIAYARLTREQAALYKSVVDQLLLDADEKSGIQRRGIVLAALTRLKQICNHPAQALADHSRLAGRSGKLTRFDELIDDILLPPTTSPWCSPSSARWAICSNVTSASASDWSTPFLHGGVSRHGRDRMVEQFQAGQPPAAPRVAEGGGHGAQPHRGLQRRPLRPVVEPGGRRPGHRSGLAHRADEHGDGAQARHRRHGRRAHRHRSSTTSGRSPMP